MLNEKLLFTTKLPMQNNQVLRYFNIYQHYDHANKRDFVTLNTHWNSSTYLGHNEKTFLPF